MYRKPGSLGVLQGVLSGPYTGGTKRVDAAKLPRASRQRLADALAGRSEPSAILYERTSGSGARFPAFWGLVVALSSIATLFAIGFGNLESPRAIQPASWVGFYLAATILFVASLVVLLRRRARSSGQALVPGRYILPLDLVVVPPLDRSGRQVLAVTPLGDARDAILHSSGRRRELVILFEDGHDERFPLRSEAMGELVLSRLEQSQHLLEELTYVSRPAFGGSATTGAQSHVGQIDKAFAHDPLFDLRVDASWDTVMSVGPGTASSAARGLFQGPVAWATAAAIAFGLAFGGLAARNRLGDRALFIRAVSQNTPEAFAAYLEKGRGYRLEAGVLREHLLAKQAEEARRASPTPPPPPTPLGTNHDCLTSLDEHGSPAHPETLRIVESLLLERARVTGDPIVPVVFTRTIEAPPADAPSLDLDAREEQLVTAFERVFSETCPASLLRFARRPRRGESGSLDVKYTVSWPRSVTWERTEMGKHVVVHGVAIAFDAALRGAPSLPETAHFHLTMPPPHDPIATLRDRSIYELPSQTRYARAMAFDEAVYPAMTARAFDRLYDEIYALFFAGDPRVPIAEPLIEAWSKK